MQNTLDDEYVKLDNYQRALIQKNIEDKCNELNIETIKSNPELSKMLYKKEQ